MNRDDVTAIAVVGGAAVLVPAILATTLDLPAWLWVPLVMLCLALAAAAIRHLVFRRQQADLRAYQPPPPPPRQEPPPPPPPVFEQVIAEVPLDSTEADYRFLFSAQVKWQPITQNGDHRNMPGLAVDAILQRARAMLAGQSPENPVTVQHSVTAELGAVRPDSTNTVAAWADAVTVTISPEDAKLLTELASLRKREKVWEYERSFESKVRTYLGEDVFTDSGSAVVWWMARNMDNVPDTVHMIPKLSELTAAANNQDRPQGHDGTSTPDPNSFFIPVSSPHAPMNGHSTQERTPADLATGLVNSLFSGEAVDRDLFVHEVASLLKSHGATGAASDLRDHFDVGDLQPPDEDAVGEDASWSDGSSETAGTESGTSEQKF